MTKTQEFTEDDDSRDDIAGFEPMPTFEELLEQAGEELDRAFAKWDADPEGRKRNYEELGKVIADWEAEHGAFTPEELEAARAQLYG